jgi:hypothetical protein
LYARFRVLRFMLAVDRDSPPEQYRETMRGVVAYYGTYTIDEAASILM